MEVVVAYLDAIAETVCQGSDNPRMMAGTRPSVRKANRRIFMEINVAYTGSGAFR
jgi:hypothetical protein